MSGLFVLLVVLGTIRSAWGQPAQGVVVSLGGEEESKMAAELGRLLQKQGLEVIYVMDQGNSEGDPLRGENTYITPSSTDGNTYDVTVLSANQSAGFPGPEEPANQLTGLSYDVILSSSRRARCKQIPLKPTWSQYSRVKILATVLDYQDACTLGIGRHLGVPVMGVVTSRSWAWWVWHWLGVTPNLATEGVPPNIMSANFGFFERAQNLWNFWRYLEGVSRQWLAPVMATLPPDERQPISAQYASLTHVTVAWDWLTDPGMPRRPFITSLFGLQYDRERKLEVSSLSSQRSKNGVVLCNLLLKELWVGFPAQRAILRALAATPFHVVWRGVVEAPEVEEQGNDRGNKSKGSAILDFQEKLDIEGILAHPRHKLMISMCGESEAAAAILFGSPILCIPLSPDQIIIARKLTELGISLAVPAHQVSTNQVRDAILQLTMNRKYRQRGRELSEYYLTLPISPADHVTHFINLVINRPMWRRRGLSEAEKLSLIYLYNADLTTAILILLISSSSAALWVVLVMLRAWRERERGKRKRRKEE